MSSIQRIMAGVILLLLAVPLPLLAQQDQAAATPFKAEELDQIVAPIALDPDPLLAQVLAFPDVYQEDLGPNTTALAEAIEQVSPDAGWTKADSV